MISFPTTGKIVACFLSLFSFAGSPLLAQHRTKDFQITLPEQKVPNSLYNSVLFLDSRPDTSNMGVVQLGAFNARARVVPEIPMAAQISNVLQAMTDNTAQPGELLFQLRQFSFAEISGAVSEKGYCYLRAMLYGKAGDRYRILGATDTVVLVKAMDVTNGLFKKGSELIAGLMASHLLSTGIDTVSYPYDDIVHIDDLEKVEMPLYQAGSYADGLYDTWEAFYQQTPQGPATVEMKKEKIVQVKANDAAGREQKINAKNIYAVVYQGRPYIATDYGYYPLEKRDNDFFFTGKARATAKTGDAIAAGLLFGGILGSLMVADATALYEMRIDHLNGGFVQVKEVKPAVMRMK